MTNIQSVSVFSIWSLRNACDDLLAHTENDEWRPIADSRPGGASADEALKREADAFAVALKTVLDEAIH